jgi:hypothetical protein
MSNAIYYRRQAVSTLALAESVTNADTKLKFTELALEYLRRADAITHERLAAYLANKHLGGLVGDAGRSDREGQG